MKAKKQKSIERVKAVSNVNSQIQSPTIRNPINMKKGMDLIRPMKVESSEVVNLPRRVSKEDYITAMIEKYSNTCKSYHNIKGAVHKTEAGSLDGRTKKQNQDSFIFIPEFMRKRERHLFAVFDGHGKLGHLVSNFLKNVYPKILEETLNKFNNVEDALFHSFEKLNNKLMDSDVDLHLSGSTANVILIEDKIVYCANVGDSRAIIGKNQNGEASGPHRVYLKNQNIPGLAMSRSFGDLHGKKAGVICIPEIKSHKLDSDSQVLVLASDGIWEFLENQTVLNMIFPYNKVNNPEKAALNLTKEASQIWKKEEGVIDDITCIIVFFNIM